MVLFFPSNILVPVINSAMVKAGQHGLLGGAPWCPGACLPFTGHPTLHSTMQAMGPGRSRRRPGAWVSLEGPFPLLLAELCHFGLHRASLSGTMGVEAQATVSQSGNSSFRAQEPTYAHTLRPGPCPTPPTCSYPVNASLPDRLPCPPDSPALY